MCLCVCEGQEVLNIPTRVVGLGVSLVGGIEGGGLFFLSFFLILRVATSFNLLLLINLRFQS